MTRRLNDSTREALEGEVVNLEYDKTRIDAQIEAIRNLLARDRPIPATAPAEGFFARSDDGHSAPIPRQRARTAARPDQRVTARATRSRSHER